MGGELVGSIATPSGRRRAASISPAVAKPPAPLHPTSTATSAKSTAVGAGAPTANSRSVSAQAFDDRLIRPRDGHDRTLGHGGPSRGDPVVLEIGGHEREPARRVVGHPHPTEPAVAEEPL